MKKSMIVMTVLMMVLSLFAENSFDETMNKITVEYMKIKDTLTNDKTDNINNNAKSILKLSKKLDLTNVTEEHQAHFKKLPMNISAAAKDLSKAKDIKAMRKAFNDLSKPMAMWVTMMKPAGINVAYCSMNPGSWLQTGKEIRNPYYGASMLKCGEIVSEAYSNKDDMMKGNHDHNMKIMDGHECAGKCDHMEMEKDHVCNDDCNHDMNMMKDHKCDSNCDHAQMGSQRMNSQCCHK